MQNCNAVISVTFFFLESAKYKLNFTQHKNRDYCLHIAIKVGMAPSLSKAVPSNRNNSTTLSNTSRNKAALTSLKQDDLLLVCW